MAGYKTSSLTASDTGRSLLKKLPTNISKQHLGEHKMFGSKRKNIQIGRKFKKGMSQSLEMDKEPGGISPSLDEFDKMMSNVVGKGKINSKKKMFSRKQFG